MGDRTNPIKFGPEWLRNLSCEPASPGSAGTGRDGMGSGTTPPGMGSSASPHRPANSTNTSNTSSKVLLAKQRYGREEMLALYDRQTAEAPAQLKTIDMLYQPRGKPPLALNISFDDDNRDSSRQPPMVPPGDRYAGAGRGRGPLSITDNRGRGLSSPDTKGRARTYNRQTSVGRGWHGNQRNSFSGMPDDDPNQTLRPWSNNNHTSPGLRPNNGEQPEWQNKQQQYRMKRQTSTNWRQQQGRDEGEEWRSADGARRPQDKWEWEWPQESSRRPNQDKQWHSNRRTWVGGEASEDALPEWAVENAEACGGTFDSSGAFHGYSNDDSNLPKNKEATYPLTRSHTHGSFVRSKTVEEGSEEWWASEKAKKLSPKRFDASEIQFKKSLPPGKADDNSNTNSSGNANSGSNGHNARSTGAIPKNSYHTTISDNSHKDKPIKKSGSKEKDEDSPENKSNVAAPTEPEEYKQKQADETSKEKTFDSRSDVNEIPNEEKGNFQSVILTSNNNTLRQKHQNIVVTPTESPKRQPQMTQYMEPTNQSRPLENDGECRNEKENNKIVEDILQMSLDDGIPSATMNQLLTNHSSSGMNSLAQLPNPPMQMRRASPLQGLGLNTQNKQNMPPSPNMQVSGVRSGMMQPIGITNSMLNASLGLPMPNSSTVLPLQGIPSPIPNPGMHNQNTLASGIQGMGGGNMQTSGIPPTSMQAASLQSGQTSALQVGGLHMQNLAGNGIQPGGNFQNNIPAGGIPNSNMQSGGLGLPGFQSSNSTMPGMSNNSMFNNMQHANNLPNHGIENASTLRRLKQLSTQSFNSLMYGNVMNQPPPPHPNIGLPRMLSDQWYYEDPNKTIQGPFSSKEMFNWYRAGFFSPTLMVRRECEAVMRPLGTYGHMPFGQMDMLPPFPMSGSYDLRPQQSHENMMNPQQGLGIDVPTSEGHPLRQPPYIESPNMQYDPRNPNQVQVAVESVGPRPDLLPPVPQPLPMPPFQLVQNNEVESLWSQPANNALVPDLMWMQAINNNSRNENCINNLPMYFWDNQPPDMPATPLLPETMKTEDEILAQMRAGQPQGQTSPLSFLAEPSTSPPSEPGFSAATAALHLDQFQKLLHKENNEPIVAAVVNEDEQELPDTATKANQQASELTAEKLNKTPEIKPVKEVAKVENAKPKVKDTKPKTKNKAKEEKKEETTETKTKEEPVPSEKRSAEPSPSSKNKKEDKSNKKELEKEKKEWIKEGFTIVKGADKNKDSKKKAEEAKVAEETERKRKEEEKIAADEKKRQLETIKKQQEIQGQSQPAQSRQAAESVIKKAPWSASSQGLQASTRDGPTLAEIQRLEREKKLEQMKEQQQMMQIIAQQQAAALAREQEIQTGLGWAKKSTGGGTVHQSLAEIQAEARKQAAAATVASAAARDESQPTPPPLNNQPWASVQNGGAGFWDSPPAEPVKPVAKPVDIIKPEPKPKKKVTVMAPPKPENTPSVEFDLWCTNMLAPWRNCSIDIPTLISFLKDIESPYEVKDYVKCYLGETREASDFARQFLERRSRLLRVGTVTPSDDLCSPAAAVNPRTNSGSDYTEVKGKGKKTKKNKMLKVDARNILGFSVTASEDRINVGDIDTV